MARSKTQQIKNTPSLDSRLAKHQKKTSDKPGSVPVTLLNLNPNQTVVLISPNGKEGEFFTGNEEEVTEMDLTNGAASNRGTGLKDGLKGPNESPHKDVLNNLTSGTTEGPVDLTAPVNDGESVSDEGNRPNEGWKESTNETQVSVSSLEVWQEAIPAPAKPSSNSASNGSDAAATVVDDKSTDITMNGFNDYGLNTASKQVVVPASMNNMSGKGKEEGKDAMALTNSVSKDSAVQGGDVVMGGVPSSPKPVQNVGFSDGAHQSYDDDLARIMIKIGDAQHLVESSTGVELEIAKENML